MIEDISDESGFVGVVLLADSSGIIFHKAFGRGKNAPDTTTAFWIASNTKPMTAQAILSLQAQGLLSVNDSLHKFFLDAPPNKRAITIEHLLTHTSGLPSDNIAEGVPERERAVRLMLSQKLIAPPSKEFHYANDGYSLLAAIIEIVSKERYEDVMQKVILMPCGMNQSGFWGLEQNTNVRIDAINDSAKYYPFYAKIFRNGKPFEDWAHKGATGVFCTSGNLYRWLYSLRSGASLDSLATKSLFQPRIVVDSSSESAVLSYGYGWAVVKVRGKTTEIRHRGRGDWMHNNSVYLLPNGYILIAWAKDNGPNAPAWSTEVCKRVITALHHNI